MLMWEGQCPIIESSPIPGVLLVQADQPVHLRPDPEAALISSFLLLLLVGAVELHLIPAADYTRSVRSGAVDGSIALLLLLYVICLVTSNSFYCSL